MRSKPRLVAKWEKPKRMDVKMIETLLRLAKVKRRDGPGERERDGKLARGEPVRSGEFKFKNKVPEVER